MYFFNFIHAWIVYLVFLDWRKFSILILCLNSILILMLETYVPLNFLMTRGIDRCILCSFYICSIFGVFFFISWYRGQVIAIDQSKYEIFFLDYGDAEWLNSCNVKPIHPSFAKVSFCFYLK